MRFLFFFFVLRIYGGNGQKDDKDRKYVTGGRRLRENQLKCRQYESQIYSEQFDE